MESFRQILGVRLRSLYNSFRFATPRQRGLSAVFLLAGLVLFLVITVGYTAFLNATRDVVPDLTHRLIERTIFFLFLFLVAGGLPFVSGVLFAPGDLPLLAGAPLRPTAIVAARLVEAAWAASAQFLAIGVPLLVASGVALRLSLLGWFWFAGATVLFLGIPALLIALLLLTLARILGVRQVKTVVALTSALLSVLLCVFTVREFSEQSHGGGGSLAALSAVLQKIPDLPKWLPSTWFSDSLLAFASNRGMTIWSGSFALLALSVLLVWLCLWLGGKVFAEESLLEGEGGTVRNKQRDLLGQALGLLPISPPVCAIIEKDFRYIARDMVLLSQIGIPLILFLVPFVIGAQIKDASNDLFLLTVGIIFTILFMETSILGLSGVGLEGRGFWLVLVAPVPIRALVFAKWLSTVIVSVLTGCILFSLACLYYKSGWEVWWWGNLCLVVGCLALSGIGTGISGLFPRFIYENPAHRASLSALIWGFVGATGYVLVAGLMLGVGFWFGYLWQENRWLWQGIGILFFLLLSLGATVVPLSAACARLEGYAWEE